MSNKTNDKDIQSVLMSMEAGEYYWCACGKSSTQPFCDGSHKGSGKEPCAVTFEKNQEVMWCMCKKTKTPPICDKNCNK